MDLSVSMPTVSRRTSLIAVGVLFAAAVVYVHLGAPSEPVRTAEFAGLMLAAFLTSGLRLQEVATNDRAIMPPSFVIAFSSLLLFGPHLAMLVVAVGAMTPSFESTPAGYPLGKRLVEIAIALTGIEAAGLAYGAL